MPLKTVLAVKDQGHNVVSYVDALGRTFDAKVEELSTQESAPAQPGSSTSTTGGTLAAATYSYRVSKVRNGVETQASTAKTQVTTGSTSTVTVTWTNDPLAQAYRVYGRVGGTELLMATLPAGSTQFVDDGSVTPSGALPAALPANSLHLRVPGLQGPFQMTLGGVPPATDMDSLSCYRYRHL
jgi:hypothetical protein